MSLNDSVLEGDFDFMNRYHPTSNSNIIRTKVDSFVGTTVAVISLDGVPLECQVLCKLLEISSRGFLLKVKEGAQNFPQGVVIFGSSCSFKAVDDRK